MRTLTTDWSLYQMITGELQIYKSDTLRLSFLASHAPHDKEGNIVSTQPGTSARREFQGEKTQFDWLTMHPRWFTDVSILSIGNIGYYGCLCEKQ